MAVCDMVHCFTGRSLLSVLCVVHTGLLVTSTIFLKSRTDGGFCREQLYWFSEQGELLGFLPFLGAGMYLFLCDLLVDIWLV